MSREGMLSNNDNESQADMVPAETQPSAEEIAAIEASRETYYKKMANARSFLQKVMLVSPINNIEEEAYRLNAIVDAANAGGAEDIARAKETIMKMYDVGPNTAIAMAAQNFEQASAGSNILENQLEREAEEVRRKNIKMSSANGGTSSPATSATESNASDMASAAVMLYAVDRLFHESE